MSRYPVPIFVLALALSGCESRSPADRAAQDVFDVTLEMKTLGDSGEPDVARMRELSERGREAAERVQTEYELMSADERDAFKKKWTKRFEEAGLQPPRPD